MQRVDGFYLYSMGGQIRPLSEIVAWQIAEKPATTYEEASRSLYIAEAALEPLLNRSIFQLKTSAQPGHILLSSIKSLRNKISEMKREERSNPVEYLDVAPVTTALTNFEAVLGAELALMPLYVVTPKAGFDTTVLIEAGSRCFPDDIWAKAPDAIPDLSQGTRCIAFELFTAAGFHLHRANEAVLRKYWDAVTKGEQRPTSRNMGDYLAEMNKRNKGDEKVKAALKDLKDLHRNPLIHPEHSLETADEAIALMNSVYTVIAYMLKEIPVTAPAPAATLPGGITPLSSLF